MSYMFYNCYSLSNLHDINKWDDSNVSEDIYKFVNCINLSNPKKNIKILLI